MTCHMLAKTKEVRIPMQDAYLRCHALGFGLGAQAPLLRIRISGYRSGTITYSIAGLI